MAIAPGLKRKGGLFGSSPMGGPYDTPGIGDGMTAAREPLAPAKPKFFGEGGVGRGIAGNIGDFLLQYSGMDPIYQPAMQQKRAMAYDEQKRERSRLQDWNDKIAFAEYERANPKPTNNDTVADYDFYKRTLTPEQFTTWLQNKIDPPQYREGPDGNFYRINTKPGPAPTFTEDDWNKGTPVTGGPTPRASGNF